MGGFNLPPGCNVSDIPGNRPEDEAAEAFEIALGEKFPEIGKLVDSENDRSQRLYETILKIAEWAFTEGSSDGYASGSADSGYAKAETLSKMRGTLSIITSVYEVCWESEITGDVQPGMKGMLRNQQQAIDNLNELINHLENK